MFYRSQFWRLQKQRLRPALPRFSFIGHNFGDYKNSSLSDYLRRFVLSVTILETTKTEIHFNHNREGFYRSQFWRLQKQFVHSVFLPPSFIGHNFGDYKNMDLKQLDEPKVLSVTILETTKTGQQINPLILTFYRSQFWRLQKQ